MIFDPSQNPTVCSSKFASPSSVRVFQVDHDRAVIEQSQQENSSTRGESIIQSLVDEVLRIRRPLIAPEKMAPQDCLIAIPAVFNNQVRSIAVLQYSRESLRNSAVEVWNQSAGRAELELVDGFHGELSHFREISLDVKFPIGVGLPGLTWSKGVPRFLKPLGSSDEFVRASEALEAGLETGIGFPIFGNQFEVQSVLLLLSSARSQFSAEYQAWELRNDLPVLKESMSNRDDDGECESDIRMEMISQEVKRALMLKRITLCSISEPGRDEAWRCLCLPVPARYGKATCLVMLFD